jgi:hypothetical protein
MEYKLVHWRGINNGITLGNTYNIIEEAFIDNNGDIRDWHDGDWSVLPVERNIEETYGPLTDDPKINPKKAAGAVKAPLHAYPMLPVIQMGNVMAGGAHKYGIYNYRESRVDALTYIGAIQRHLMKWQDGVDFDEESQQSELAHIMACCSILLDCQITGNLIDNRNKTGKVEAELKRSEDTFKAYTSSVQSLEERNAKV